jgi:hypothetical protein
LVSAAAALLGAADLAHCKVFSEEAGAGNMPPKVEIQSQPMMLALSRLGEIAMMEMDRFQNAVIAELAALKYIVEQIGEIAFLVATMRPEHAATMRQQARIKLMNETYPGLEAVWSNQLGEQIAESASAMLTNIESALTKAYRDHGGAALRD